jgi:hypothetical protein
MSFEEKTNEEPEVLREMVKGDEKIREKVIQLSKDEYEQMLNEEIIKYKHLKSVMADEREIMERNAQKVIMNWRKVLSLMKSTDLKQQLEVEASLFQRELDSKDVIIQSLDNRLENCFAQYEMALRAHFIHIDKFNLLTNSKIKALQEDFMSNINLLRQEFAAEHEEIMILHQSQVL